MFPEKKKTKIGIIGLGLIGGSLALRLSQKYPFMALSGNPKLLSSNLLKFEITENWLTLLEESDLIFICSPLHKIQEVLLKIREHYQELKTSKKRLILTDVGSTKKQICEFAKEIFKEEKELIFIGGHPMSGTEKSGFENAFESLFENNPWVLTPEKELLDSSEVCQLKEIITQMGSSLIELDPETHDRAVAWISHLPLLLSLGLKQAVQEIEDPKVKEASLKLASSGFESMTRLARGNQVLNQDLIELNKTNLKKSLQSFLETIEKFV